ncbi:hypothetical protein ACFWTE_27715 [Nocardiopsis sp. NPDC058631]|uniref:hypothetical protein n=1 Tax=Nocardiopsis sp. NPDC058631 TaxID=3346566 RepID=UPI00365B7F61
MGRRRPRPEVGGNLSTGAAFGVLLGGALVTYLLLQVAVQFSGHELRSVGAAYSWAGQEGTLEVTGSHIDHGSGEQQCVGTFRPAESGPARTDVDLYLSGTCEEGGTEEVRLVPSEDTWLTTTERDRAYADAGLGSGIGSSVTTLVFVNAFCLGFGLLSALYSLSSGALLLRRLRRRWRQWRAPSAT